MNGLYFFAIASISSIIFLLISESGDAGVERVSLEPCRDAFSFRSSHENFRRERILSKVLIRRRGAARLIAMMDASTLVAEQATGVSQDTRFALELEFVMSLANPRYLHHLAQEKYFDDPAFVAYLEYLQYWKQPGYAKYLHYPHALHFLDQLQRAEFRNAMANPRAVEHVFTQQFFLWQKHRSEQMENELAGKGADGAKE